MSIERIELSDADKQALSVGPGWRDHQAAINSKALATATEISLMWGQDRSQFVSRIQAAVTDAMLWLKGALPAASQEAARWVIVRESVLDVGLGDDVRTGGRPELGYALLADAATYESEDAARAALRTAGLPIGWVVMPLARLLPDLA